MALSFDAMANSEALVELGCCLCDDVDCSLAFLTCTAPVTSKIVPQLMQEYSVSILVSDLESSGCN